MLRGPTSCRRSFKQGAKHKSIVYFVFVYILQTVVMASTLISPMVDYYNDEEELDSVDDDDDRSFRGRDSEEGNVKLIRENLRPSGSVYLLETKRKFTVVATMWLFTF